MTMNHRQRKAEEKLKESIGFDLIGKDSKESCFTCKHYDGHGICKKHLISHLFCSTCHNHEIDKNRFPNK